MHPKSINKINYKISISERFAGFYYSTLYLQLKVLLIRTPFVYVIYFYRLNHRWRWAVEVIHGREATRESLEESHEDNTFKGSPFLYSFVGGECDKITNFRGSPTLPSHVITFTSKPKYSSGLLPSSLIVLAYIYTSNQHGQAMVDQKSIKATSNFNFFVMKRATMAAFLPNYHVRSISLPTRSHPSTVKVEEQLNKLKACEGEDSSSSQAEKICRGLTGLVKLYSCIEELLNLPLTQRALSHHQKEKWVNEIVDGSVRYLDICNKTRDTVLLMKESVSELQSALRRSKGGEFKIEGDVGSYNSCRHKTKKEAAKSISSLRQMENRLGASSLILDLDQHLSAVVRVLREASLIVNSIFQQLLLFLSAPVMKPKPRTKWSLVSKLVQRGVTVVREDQGRKMNVLERVDVALSNLLVQNPGKDSEAEMIQSAQNRLEDLEKSIERIENGLGCLFRRLIQTRVCLLNILSH